MSMDYERRGRVTLIESLLRYVPGALYTIRNMLGLDPDGGGVPDATTLVKGKVELATVAEALAGTDTVRAVTPDGLAAAVAAGPGSSGLLKIRLKFEALDPTPTATIHVNETDADLVIARTGTGSYTITASEPIFTLAAYVFVSSDRYSASSFQAEAHIESTTVVRLITGSHGGDAPAQTIALNPIPVMIDIFPEA